MLFDFGRCDYEMIPRLAIEFTIVKISFLFCLSVSRARNFPPDGNVLSWYFWNHERGNFHPQLIRILEP